MRTEKTLKHQGTVETVSEMKAIWNQDATGKFAYRHPKEGDEAHRWRCMKRNMRHDERIDRDAGMRMLQNARKLPSASKGNFFDMQELEAEFEERFGAPTAEQPQERGKFR